jgi:hypothetical protein
MSELLKKRAIEAIGHALAGILAYYYTFRFISKRVLCGIRAVTKTQLINK